MNGRLILKDGTVFEGTGFGKTRPVAGEVVFATGMVGYPESLTDPSYKGQILVMTYPLVGSYGVPDRGSWESRSIKALGLIVSNYIDTPSHHSSKRTLRQWLEAENIPALEVKDTRALTKKLRTEGVSLAKIVFGRDIKFSDPNERNLVADVSTKKVIQEGSGRKTVVLVDCGVKQNIVAELLKRKVRVITVPWNYNIFEKKLCFDGILFSNGPGDPKMATDTIALARTAMEKRIPILGICLGNQILTLAAGGDTYKLRFGHRGQNHGAILVGTKKCYLTTQNHGFSIKRVPKGFRPWFINANDQTNEGIIHEKLPFMSVQFHPESHPGPLDTGWIFDEFLKQIK
ncbi:MAG: carbamoyl phosphate synthase small subunit [Candidatus Doudnabacteria bacterium RIFCSPHIGHO2_02_FULL_48_21]|nr:MAG: carbamoyl phosphate synthase small subunit [Candidatus Doudnabacteria bacterium RIFCSPHIGHO2_01_48_18]OGE79840.1 MAG: carbamoyl phosphate synthase small subunit [Candidatus Doudnabacteria bacterium RIFCSPHIGHO2_01_FULL_48_180]OGE91379.1 MAG: carbamoyl phosphate synthase small subunit [Candidatus Doudnabacteria bacterium RIFCSPHIGHO2_12_FULL_47_25]OGE93191.1 MAG: carbamoyl phosphate synthase small subunit [Candidatus Doudnabacteria bacterium RIFCSPHIGHO2_02_FULL_48_21]OGE96712.1 MAG: car